MLQEPSEEPFDIDSVPKEVKSQPLSEKKSQGKKPSGLGAPPSGPTSTVDAYERILSSIPEFSTFGNLFKVFSLFLLCQSLMLLMACTFSDLISYCFIFVGPVFGAS